MSLGVVVVLFGMSQVQSFLVWFPNVNWHLLFTDTNHDWLSGIDCPATAFPERTSSLLNTAVVFIVVCIVTCCCVVCVRACQDCSRCCNASVLTLFQICPCRASSPQSSPGATSWNTMRPNTRSAGTAFTRSCAFPRSWRRCRTKTHHSAAVSSLIRLHLSAVHAQISFTVNGTKLTFFSLILLSIGLIYFQDRWPCMFWTLEY